MTHRHRFAAIGTEWEIETGQPLDDRARAAIAQTIDAFDREWSRFRSDSLVTRLARDPGTAAAPSDTAAMLDAYAELSAATAGAVNPLVGGSLEHLGYDADYSLRPQRGAPMPSPGWRRALRWSADELTLAEPAIIDVGALGKGRLVDRVMGVLAAGCAGTIVVDAGGDIAVRGRPTRIGLEHPHDARRAIGVVEVAAGAVAASAANRRAWGDGLHHVLDARTGVPVRTVAATWAFAATAMRADAIATALFFDGGPRIAREWDVTWVRMLTDGRVERSPECPARLFTRDDVPGVP